MLLVRVRWRCQRGVSASCRCGIVRWRPGSAGSAEDDPLHLRGAVTERTGQAGPLHPALADKIDEVLGIRTRRHQRHLPNRSRRAAGNGSLHPLAACTESATPSTTCQRPGRASRRPARARPTQPRRAARPRCHHAEIDLSAERGKGLEGTNGPRTAVRCRPSARSSSLLACKGSLVRSPKAFPCQSILCKREARRESSAADCRCWAGIDGDGDA